MNGDDHQGMVPGQALLVSLVAHTLLLLVPAFSPRWGNPLPPSPEGLAARAPIVVQVLPLPERQSKPSAPRSISATPATAAPVVAVSPPSAPPVSQARRAQSQESEKQVKPLVVREEIAPPPPQSVTLITEKSSQREGAANGAPLPPSEVELPLVTQESLPLPVILTAVAPSDAALVPVSVPAARPALTPSSSDAPAIKPAIMPTQPQVDNPAPPSKAAPVEPPPTTRVAARLVNRTPPRYPDAARRASQSGVVHLRLQVSTDGKVKLVDVVESSGYPLLDASAVAAAKLWRFEPATENGHPVAEWRRVAVEFRLEDAAG